MTLVVSWKATGLVSYVVVIKVIVAIGDTPSFHASIAVFCDDFVRVSSVRRFDITTPLWIVWISCLEREEIPATPVWLRIATHRVIRHPLGVDYPAEQTKH